MALNWDFARQLDPAATPGSTVSYFDETCQSFYIDTGQIKAQIGQLSQGHWQDLEREPEIIVSDIGYGALDIEHNFNGTVFGMAQHNADVVFFIYEYMVDVTNWLDSGDWQLQPDNPIKAGSITLINADSKRFDDSVYSIFSPGSKIDLNCYIGNSEPYQLAQFFIEGSPFTVGGKAVTLDGRNRIGYQLATQTMDEAAALSGTRTEIVNALLAHAGVPVSKRMVYDDTTIDSYNADPTKKALSILEELVAVWNWYFDDTSNGTIVVGPAEYLRENVAATGIYTFNRGSDLTSRSIKRQSDGVYSRVAIMREGEFPRTIYGDVDYFEGWYIARYRTFYQKVPDITSDAVMDTLLVNMQEAMQYYGITENFSGLFRPHLQIGDVAIVTGGNAPRIAGVITEVKHAFGRSGFKTEFTSASGGKISNPNNPATVATKYINRLGGANRQRRMIDYILQGDNTISGTSNKGSTGGPGDPGSPGAPGDPGDPGASAYQVWQSLGNTGTEQDFINSLSQNAVPIGSVQLWTTGTAPTDWLLCDGQAISRTIYADLFTLVGTTYGTGDGTTTFNLPTITDPVTGVSYMIKVQ